MVGVSFDHEIKLFAGELARYLINNNGVLSFGNIPRIMALKLLYQSREISYYHCEPDVRAEIDKMVADGWLKYDEYLLSPEERHYLNFFLNNS